jgi:hypothetical protein
MVGGVVESPYASAVIILYDKGIPTLRDTICEKHRHNLASANSFDEDL